MTGSATEAFSEASGFDDFLGCVRQRVVECAARAVAPSGFAGDLSLLRPGKMLRTRLAGRLAGVADATDLTEGSVNYGLRLPYRPEYTWGAGGSVTLIDWLDIGLSAFGSGLRFTNSSQTAALPVYTVLSGSVRADLPIGGWSLVLYATNALDEEYEETDGYPGQPRTIGLYINWMEE